MGIEGAPGDTEVVNAHGARRETVGICCAEGNSQGTIGSRRYIEGSDCVKAEPDGREVP